MGKEERERLETTSEGGWRRRERAIDGLLFASDADGTSSNAVESVRTTEGSNNLWGARQRARNEGEKERRSRGPGGNALPRRQSRAKDKGRARPLQREAVACTPSLPTNPTDPLFPQPCPPHHPRPTENASTGPRRRTTSCFRSSLSTVSLAAALRWRASRQFRRASVHCRSEGGGLIIPVGPRQRTPRPCSLASSPWLARSGRYTGPSPSRHAADPRDGTRREREGARTRA